MKQYFSISLHQPGDILLLFISIILSSLFLIIGKRYYDCRNDGGTLVLTGYRISKLGQMPTVLKGKINKETLLKKYGPRYWSHSYISGSRAVIYSVLFFITALLLIFFNFFTIQDMR